MTSFNRKEEDNKKKSRERERERERERKRVRNIKRQPLMKGIVKRVSCSRRQVKETRQGE